MNVEQRIQPNENLLLTSINEIKKSEPERKNRRIFGLKSNMEKEMINKKVQNLLSTSKVVDEYLVAESVPIDEDGHKIINYTSEKGWFFDNVSFIFATGAIFDEVDTVNLDHVLQCFNVNANQAYLKNRYFVLDYSNPVVQKMESLFGIKNGNYRILCAVVVSASDEDLKKSPMKDFSHKGVIKVETIWKSIDSMFAKYISVFGFIAEHFERQDITYGNGQRMLRKNSFDPQPASSPMDLLNTPIEKFTPGGKKNDYNEHEFKQIRTAKTFGESQRGKNNDVSGDFRKKEASSLYDRISHQPLRDLPSKQVGATLRLNDFYLDEDDEPEYIIYNDLSTYDKTIGKNIFAANNPDLKKVMPNFSTNHATIDKILNNQRTGKNANGTSTRTVIGSSVLVFPK